MTEEQQQQFAQAAITACAGKAEGDACVFENPRGNSTGSCANRNGTLSCLPKDGGRGYNRTVQG